MTLTNRTFIHGHDARGKTPNKISERSTKKKSDETSIKTFHLLAIQIGSRCRRNEFLSEDDLDNPLNPQEFTLMVEI